MEIDSASLSVKEAYALMIACIVPRPVAWVSTLSTGGVRNLAPFSYFMGVGSKPPMLAVSVGHRKGRSKDTGHNVRETGEFVVNICTRRLAEQMASTAGEYEADIDEFEVAGLTACESKSIRAPGVLESPVRLECKLHQVVEPAASVDLLIGEVLHFHVEDSILTDGLPDAAKLDPVARLGGPWYASLGEIFAMERPRTG